MSLPNSKEAREAVHTLCPAGDVLDVGAGGGEHTRWFYAQGFDVTAVDSSPEFPECHKWLWPYGEMPDSLDYKAYNEGFDIVWAAHVLEHQRNPGAFLTDCRVALKLGGFLAVTVPPLKHEIVGGHLSLWNAGLLLYNLVMAGFDCSQASVKTYGYNVSVIVPRCTSLKEELEMRRVLDTVTYDHGDIELLREYFPLPVKQGFNGVIEEVNWP
jgi:SAM-dependent methyltransferase